VWLARLSGMPEGCIECAGVPGLRVLLAQHLSGPDRDDPAHSGLARSAETSAATSGTLADQAIED
jgi:hypothetical protein